MAAQLLDVGEPVSDLTIMAKILASLSSKYAAFQTAWDSVSPEQQTLNNLQERLIREEARLTAEDERPGAFSAYKKNAAKKNDAKNATGKSQKSDWRKDVECYKCKKRGHFARECRSKKSENQNGRAGKDTRDCAFVAEKHRQQSKMCDKSNTKLPSTKFAMPVTKMSGLPTVELQDTSHEDAIGFPSTECSLMVVLSL
jgi:hypothetical protein